MKSLSDRTEEAFTRGEEILNALTHGIGAILAVIGLTALFLTSTVTDNPLIFYSILLYGSSLCLLYGFSTLYHATPHKKLKRFFHTLDYCAIFLMIAGTYTPFALLAIGGTAGILLFATIWVLALGGIIIRLAWPALFMRISIGYYLAMGWLAVLMLQPVLSSIGSTGTGLLVGGGLCYTAGILFYIWHRLPFNHAYWHVMVMFGSAMHYFAVLQHVMPAAMLAA